MSSPVDHSRPLFTIITSMGRPEYTYLKAAGESLLPLNSFASEEGAGVEWLIAVNETSGYDRGELTLERVRETLTGLPISRTIIDANGQGIGVSRNTALAIAAAPWMYSLDGDDTVNANGLWLLYEAARRENTNWAAGKTYTIDADGCGHGWTGGPANAFNEGRLTLNSYYRSRIAKGDWPFATNAVLARTDAVRRTGGWADWQRSEDHAMVSVLSAQDEGVWVDTYVHDYRRHSNSITADPSWGHLDERLLEIAAFIDAGTTQLARV